MCWCGRPVHYTGVGSGGGAGRGGMCPHSFERGGGKDMFVPPPHFQTQNLGLGIEPTDICDVTLAWLASRCWARQMCPPPTFCHVPTPLHYVYLVCLSSGMRLVWEIPTYIWDVLDQKADRHTQML